MEIEFATILDTTDLLTILTIDNIQLEISSYSFLWDEFVHAVDTGGKFSCDYFTFDSEHVIFNIGRVGGAIGITVTLPMDRCKAAFRRFRDVINEFAESHQNEFIRDHPRRFK